MTIKEFLENETLISVEIIDNYDLIINLITENGLYGLNVDTSTIPSGQHITNYDNFTIIDDILTCNGISINITEIEML